MKRLEYILGKNSILFSTPQRALEACLESLGVGIYSTPIVLPVTSPTWVASAVIRSGGIPVLLDVYNLFEYKYNSLKEIVNEEEELVILHLDNLIGNNSIKSLVKDRVNIYLSSNYFCLRDNELTKDFHFIVCETESPLIPFAGIVHSKYEDCLSTILNVRSGILGIGDYYPKELSDRFENNYKYSFQWYNSEFLKLYRKFEDLWYEKSIKYYISSNIEWLPIIVENARKTLVLFQDRGIECKLDFQPLYTFSEIGQRFKEPPEPNYPEAQKLYNKVLSIRVNESNLNKLKGEIV